MDKRAELSGSNSRSVGEQEGDLRDAPGALKIYYVHTRLLGRLSDWPRHLQRAAGMRFSHVCVAPIFEPHASGDVFLTADLSSVDPTLGVKGSADQAAAQLAALCNRYGLRLILDVVLDRVAADGPAAQADLFIKDRPNSGIVDPRSNPPDMHGAVARFDDGSSAPRLADWWTARLSRLLASGVAGFRYLGIDRVPGASLRRMTEGLRRQADCLALGWTPGVAWSRLPDLSQAGFDGVFASTPWWDGRASWYVEEHEALRRIAPVIGMAEAPFGPRLTPSGDVPEAGPAHHRRALRLAAATGSGLLVPMGFEFMSRRAMNPRTSVPEDLAEAEEDAPADLSEDVAAANELVDRIQEFGAAGEMRGLTSPSARVTALARVDAADMRAAEKGVVILVNTDLARSHPVPVSLDPIDSMAGALLGYPESDSEGDVQAALAPGEVRVAFLRHTGVVRDARRRDRRQVTAAAERSPVVINSITPQVAGGPFAAKRVVGQAIEVEADVFADGHDILAAELLWRAVDEKEWRRAPLGPLANDRWRATMTPTRIGAHHFTIEAWRDDYATLCHGLELKHRAGVDVALDLAEARIRIERLGALSERCRAAVFSEVLASLDANDTAASVEALTARRTRDAVAAAGGRAFAVRHEPLVLEVERPQAEFAAWYELFPRSQTDDPSRHGTFDDVIGQLPRIRAMGFDVLYFPPIHPIGKTNRKGRNNALVAGAGDPGSPYAIGGEEGGHDALHPQLGTPADFRRLVAAARDHGLEIALDFAIQCSLDHPWLREHPEWFRWRADGSIRYAENPPKKYEDIVNVDFHAEGATPALWLALRDVVLHWVVEGVRIFRVDNPHTKPLPFWQWLIADVRGRHPDVIFLSEAFTRPKVMYRLAKVGFSQSYTYFTWRNTKRELTDYLVELTTTDVTEFFRPHFFVNTPDINPYFLQTSGRPGFLIRAALAATLSGLWGIYSGFELCESAALPGREEYLDSEKYEIRVRDFAAPGNIVAEIAVLNRIRKAHPALHSHLGVRFYNAFNDQVLLYGKATPAREDMILVAVSLDPHGVQEAAFEVPLWEWNLPDDGSVMVEDLMRGDRFTWSGKLQQMRLDPAVLPFAIWRIAPLGGGR